jgi:hypothetical protein
VVNGELFGGKSTKTTVKDFRDFEVREYVDITTGQGADWSSHTALVTAQTVDTLHVALSLPPEQPARLAHGSLIRVRRRYTVASVRSQVLTYEPGPHPVVVVRPLVVPDAVENVRAYHRVPTQLEETYITAVLQGRVLRFRVHVVDLSGGGARIRAAQPLTAGDRIELSLPAGSPSAPAVLRVPGWVAWVQPVERSWQAGIRFDELSPGVHDQIVRAVFAAEMHVRTVI